MILDILKMCGNQMARLNAFKSPKPANPGCKVGLCAAKFYLMFAGGE